MASPYRKRWPEGIINSTRSDRLFIFKDMCPKITLDLASQSRLQMGTVHLGESRAGVTPMNAFRFYEDPATRALALEF